MNNPQHCYIVWKDYYKIDKREIVSYDESSVVIKWTNLFGKDFTDTLWKNHQFCDYFFNLDDAKSFLKEKIENKIRELNFALAEIDSYV